MSEYSSKSMLSVGTLLAGGKYRVERVLSSGGFGNAYVVTNTNFEETCALKEFFIRGVNERLSDSRTISVSNEENTRQFETMRRKFRTEAVRLRRLHNEHIVKVHDLFEENGTTYYVMDYIDGESLSARLKRTGKPLAESEVWGILHQVLEALEVVHEQNIFHLDIKPGNIMMERSGTAVLIDFGASKQFHDAEGNSVSTSTGLCYTAGYAPLEQTSSRTKQFGPWTDLYALGATLYNLLTNQTPPDPTDILTESDALRLPKNVSNRMQRLITWMMAPKYTERPQSVADIRAWLQQESSGPAKKPETPSYDPEADEETEYKGATHGSAAKKGTSKKKETPRQAEKPRPSQPTDDETLFGQTKNGGNSSHKSVGEEVDLEEIRARQKRSKRKMWIWIPLSIVGIIILSVAGAFLYYEYMENNDRNASYEVADSWTCVENDGVLTFKAYTSSGEVSFKMIEVEGGKFNMGANSAYDDEKPVHKVTLSSYYIGETEITQAVWKAVMGNNPSNFKGDKRPVECVSWNDAHEFIARLNAKTGREFRLPTEAEWEFAARGGNKSKNYSYSGSDNLNAVAWYYDNSGSETHDVATQGRNELGLYDMSGNVWEWCEDWYGSYGSQSVTNPRGPETGSSRVRRGGGWGNSAERCRSACRLYYYPACQGNDLGFRLAL